MDPISAALIAALTAGVAGGLTEAGKNLIGDAYQALKAALQQKFGADSDLAGAVEGLEKKPDSKGRAGTLQEEIAATGADKDPKLLELAGALRQALEAGGHGSSYQATLSGSGAMAQGEGAAATAATGQGSIAIGSVGGDVSLGGREAEAEAEAEAETKAET